MTVKEDLVLVLTIESVVLGVVLGFMIRPFNPSNDAISLIGFPGEIFMQIVEMMILPLIISSVISALAQIRPNDAGRIGGLTVLYYVMTTFLSTNMFPENIIQATFQQVQTNYIPVKPRIVVRQPPWMNATNSSAVASAAVSGAIVAVTGATNLSLAAVGANTTTAPKIVMKPILEYTNEVNVLGLIVFCTGFGVILSILGEQARLMINFFIVLDAVIMKWISALMWCYPIGILSLVCKNILDIDNLTETAQALAMYVVTVICGLMIHSLLTLPLLYYLFTRDSPFDFMTGMLQAIATAFGTASSGASLPVTFRSLEGNLKIDRRVTRFVLPLGATITMDGTALYEAVAVIFIAQLHNVQLSILELLTISLTTTVASIGSGSVPAGLDTIHIVLATVGLPAKDLSLLLTVDWLLDRIRTSVNVLGDGFGCGIIYHLTKKRLIESDNDELIQQLKSDIKLLNADLQTQTNLHLQPSHFQFAHNYAALNASERAADAMGAAEAAAAADDVDVRCAGQSRPILGTPRTPHPSTSDHPNYPHSSHLGAHSHQFPHSDAWQHAGHDAAQIVAAAVGATASQQQKYGARRPTPTHSHHGERTPQHGYGGHRPTPPGAQDAHFLAPPSPHFAAHTGGAAAEVVSTASVSPRKASSASRVSRYSSQGDERRSLLDGSMEFTV